MTQSNPLHSEAGFPEPEQDAQALSEELCSHIKGLIKENNGKIGFDEFMSAALYEPGLGYFACGRLRLGRFPQRAAPPPAPWPPTP